MKKYIINGWIFSLIALLLSTCEFDPQPVNLVYTGEVFNERENSAEIEGTIVSVSGNLEEFGHCWIEKRGGETLPRPEDAIKDPLRITKFEQINTTDNTYISLMRGLFPGTEYFVWAYVKVDGVYFFGKTQDFKTKGFIKDDITLNFVTNIARDSARAHSRINKLLEGEILERGHCWVVAEVLNNNNPIYTDARSAEDATIGERNASDFESKLNGLRNNTTYRIRAFVRVKLPNNQEKIYYSNNTMSFTTY
jgi:hypothetical protein